MYIRVCLKDEAAEVIASLETTSENYLVAWELLKNRYDNRKFIVESHIKALFEFQQFPKNFQFAHCWIMCKSAFGLFEHLINQ